MYFYPIFLIPDICIKTPYFLFPDQPYIVPVQFQTNGTFVPDLSKNGSDLFTNRSVMLKTGVSMKLTHISY